MRIIARWLGLASKFLFASILHVSGRNIDLLIAICHATGADHYYSALGSKAYIEKDSEAFSRAGILLEYQQWPHPEHDQGKVKMRCTVLQPTYLPWIGYFEMISASETFVVYDHVQFVRKSWHQRNKIKTANGITMLSVPVQHDGQTARICDVRISYEGGNVLQKHWKSIEVSYRKSPYFKGYQGLFKEIYSKEHVYLKDLNVAIIKAICGVLGIKNEIIYSSNLTLPNSETNKSKDVVDLCKTIGANYIYDAKGAETFLDKEVFRTNGVEIQFQEYDHPVYSQLWGEFQPYMSAIDLLFNEGPASMEIIKKGRKELTVKN